jgi:YtkA-like
VLIVLAALSSVACGRTGPVASPLHELQRVHAGEIDVLLLAPTTALAQTRNFCTFEFRTGTDHRLVDVGTVTVRTTMAMEGQAMDGYVTDVKRVDTGRYEVQMVLAMSGSWQISVGWDGAAGRGTATFAAMVR